MLSFTPGLHQPIRFAPSLIRAIVSFHWGFIQLSTHELNQFAGIFLCKKPRLSGLSQHLEFWWLLRKLVDDTSFLFLILTPISRIVPELCRPRVHRFFCIKPTRKPISFCVSFHLGWAIFAFHRSAFPQTGCYSGKTIFPTGCSSPYRL